jgi:hypothetical protein
MRGVLLWLAVACRDVTITGLPGTTPLLDLHRQAGVVQLCATCTLRLANISLSNLTRSGAGIVTFFRGQLGARMVQQNGFSVRLVCQRTDVELAVVNQTQRSSRFPSPPGGEQLAGSVNASYLVSLTSGSLQLATARAAAQAAMYSSRYMHCSASSHVQACACALCQLLL